MVYENESYIGMQHRPVSKSYFIEEEKYVPAKRAELRY